jgi:hypothetical protein
MSAMEIYKTPHPGGALDEAHIGDIRGTLGTIRHCDIAPRIWLAVLRGYLVVAGGFVLWRIELALSAG